MRHHQNRQRVAQGGHSRHHRGSSQQGPSGVGTRNGISSSEGMANRVLPNISAPPFLISQTGPQHVSSSNSAETGIIIPEVIKFKN